MPAAATVWICDVNGVLIDSAAVMRAAFAATIARFRIQVSPHELRRVNGYLLRDAYGILDPGGDAIARSTFHLDYLRERIAAVRAHAEVAHTLSLAKEAGARIAAVTSCGQLAEACLVRAGLYAFIDCLVTQEEVRLPKPDPEALVRSLGLLGVDRGWQRSRAVCVGDTAVDIAAGKAAGIRTVGVTYGVGDGREIRDAMPDYIIHRFGGMGMFLQMPCAGRVVSTHADHTVPSRDS